MSRRRVYGALAVVCAVPRLVVLLHERDTILGANTEKSDIFAQTFVAHGTFGFIPGEPSAYTQPLYGWFLIPVYWIFGRTWWSVGIAQILLAVVTAVLVYEIGRRLLGPRAGLVGAVIATLNPYLIWHDVHVNREIVDQVVAAALVLLTLVVAERPSLKLATLLGAVTGLSMLGNTRLVGIPVLCAVYLAFRLPRARATAIVCGLVLVGRDRRRHAVARPQRGQRRLLRDHDRRPRDVEGEQPAARTALLSSGQWIDNVGQHPPRPPRAGPPHAGRGARPLRQVARPRSSSIRTSASR